MHKTDLLPAAHRDFIPGPQAHLGHKLHLSTLSRVLLEAGASPWGQDHHFHRTCLHYAAVEGHAGVVAPVVERSQAMPHPHAPSSLMSTFNNHAADEKDAFKISATSPLIVL